MDIKKNDSDNNNRRGNSVRYQEFLHDYIVETGLFNKENADLISSRFLEKLIDNSQRMDYIKSRSITFLSEVIRFYEEIYNAYGFKNSDLFPECVERIIVSDEISEIQSTFTYLFERITEILSYFEKEYLSIEKALVYTERYYMYDINLDKISQLAGYSASYFSRIFKRAKNMNYTTYLNRIRIRKAEELIKNTEEKLHIISDMVGYNDFNYFSSIFKRVTGKSLSEYRNLPHE